MYPPVRCYATTSSLPLVVKGPGSDSASLPSDTYKKRLTGMAGRMRVLMAVVHREGDAYVAHCPEVGTTSQGPTVEEAVANLREATELYLEEFPTKAFPRPIVTTFEVAGAAET